MENLPEASEELLQKARVVQPRKMMKPIDDVPILLRKRYYVIVGIMISWIVLVILRTNLSICLVEMTSSKTITKDNRTYIQEPEFRWTSIEKGIILSSFSWGLLFSPVGGLLVPTFGAVKLFGLGIMGISILTVVRPVLIKQHFLVYLIGRFMEGFSEGISASSEAGIYMHWAPPSERTLLTNTSNFGFSLGLIITYPMSAYLIASFGWEKTFYITGAIGILWSLIWLIYVRGSPAEDGCMLEAERNYLEQIMEPPSLEKIKYPLKQILTSKPAWAFWNELFVESWSLSFFAFCLPLYLKDVFDMNIEEIGWLSSVPFYFENIVRIPSALIADYLRKEKIMSATSVHKTYILLAQIGGLVFLAVTALSRNSWLSFTAATLSRSIFSIASISYGILPLDIGNQYGSFIMGAGYTGRSIGYILNPLIMGFMITNRSVTEWSRYFMFLCCFNAWALIIFAIYGSGETQPWANPPKDPLKTFTPFN